MDDSLCVALFPLPFPKWFNFQISDAEILMQIILKQGHIFQKNFTYLAEKGFALIDF